MGRADVKAIIHSDVLSFVSLHSGTEVMKVNDGERFQIGCQISGYYPIKRNGSFEIYRIRAGLLGRGDNYIRDEMRDVKPEAVVRDGKKYHLAMNAASAKNGIAHPYRPPVNELDAWCIRKGHRMPRVAVVDHINIVTWEGGNICGHRDGGVAHHLLYDGTIVRGKITLNDDDSNQYHRNCIARSYKVAITGGTYLAEFREHAHRGSSGPWHLEKITISKNANKDVVIQTIVDTLTERNK